MRAEAFAERTISLTDIAWAGVALDDVEAQGGLLDEARVNRLRYLEGTPKGSTRFIDTGWAIAALQRARRWLPESTEVLQVHDDTGRPIDARFEVERSHERLSLLFHSRGGARGAAAERNTDYAQGLELLLGRLAKLGVEVIDGFVDSASTASLPEGERRLLKGLSYPLRIEDPAQARKALGRAMAKVGRKAGAKGGGNQNKRIRLVLRASMGVNKLGRRLSCKR